MGKILLDEKTLRRKVSKEEREIKRGGGKKGENEETKKRRLEKVREGYH